MSEDIGLGGSYSQIRNLCALSNTRGSILISPSTTANADANVYATVYAHLVSSSYPFLERAILILPEHIDDD